MNSNIVKEGSKTTLLGDFSSWVKPSFNSEKLEQCTGMVYSKQGIDCI